MESKEQIIQKKKELRKEIRERKKAVPFDEKVTRSKSIWSQLEKLSVFQQSSYIMAYWSMKDEVHTHDFIQKYSNKKKIILPAIIEDELELRYYEGVDSMKPDPLYHILEPAGKIFENISLLDLIIVPGVAFDKEMNRLGRGKAFYDKLLSNISCPKIGVCFDFQLVENVPHEPTDIKMDKVIHET